MTQTHRNPTIKDVAALAGCSVTTVSHVLNDVPGTSLSTCDTVVTEHPARAATSLIVGLR